MSAISYLESRKGGKSQVCDSIVEFKNKEDKSRYYKFIKKLNCEHLWILISILFPLMNNENPQIT